MKLTRNHKILLGIGIGAVAAYSYNRYSRKTRGVVMGMPNGEETSEFRGRMRRAARGGGKGGGTRIYCGDGHYPYPCGNRCTMTKYDCDNGITYPSGGGAATF